MRTINKTKWFIYTVFIGLLPIATRILVWLITNNGPTTVISPGDVVAFGLILHISVLNEIEHLPSKDKNWKTIQNGVSIFFIVIYSTLYAITLIGESANNVVDFGAVRTCSIGLALTSLLLSFSALDRFNHSKVGGEC
ncbi:hypothetical protein [Derxia lacustris]|uniref:hypothetical protein n=1 Tax=Derxia lacustris TaxID=764842 RepID=UPI000A172339|nr:hypothetical protein [Derxia lacustris]